MFKRGAIVRCIRPGDVLEENALYRIVYRQAWVYVRKDDIARVLLGDHPIQLEPSQYAITVSLKAPKLIVEAIEAHIPQPGGYLFDEDRFQKVQPEESL